MSLPRPLPRVVRHDIDRIAETRAILPTLPFRKPLLTLVWMTREVFEYPGVRRRPARAAPAQSVSEGR